MSLSFGVFDVLANAIPGSLYLVLTVYVGVRFGWIDPADLVGLDTTVALVGAVVASYLLGHILGSSLRRVVELVPLWRPSSGAIRREFRERNPALANRGFVTVDPFTLLAALRQTSPDAAVDVDRSRATGVMLRSCTPAFAMGAVVAAAEAAATGRLVGLVVAVALAVISVLSLREGRKFVRWAHIYTLECAAWIPEIDARLAEPSPVTPETRTPED